MSRIILFIQPDTKPETKDLLYYIEYASLNECLEGICKIYEELLKRQNPHTDTLLLSLMSYDISQLFEFMDQFAVLFCIVYQKGTSTYAYAPYTKDWIKEKIYNYILLGCDVRLRRRKRSNLLLETNSYEKHAPKDDEKEKPVPADDKNQKHAPGNEKRKSAPGSQSKKKSAPGSQSKKKSAPGNEEKKYKKKKILKKKGKCLMDLLYSTEV